MDEDQFCTSEVCVCGLCGECGCGYGDHVCDDCAYEVNVSMFLFDVMEKVVARYRPGGAGRLGARVLALSRARSPETEARASVAFDMLWPEGES